ncbi:MAG: arylsulfatase [Pseudomonadota bacterium]
MNSLSFQTGGRLRTSAILALAHLIIVSCTMTAPAEEVAETDWRPNILLVLTDDQGYSDVGFNGNPHVRTPVLDTFSESALVFDQFYTQPVCSPTRAALLTGQFAARSGVIDTQAGAALLPTEKVTLAEMLQSGGYATGLFGKWHLGDNAPMRPEDQGFDRVLRHDGGMIGTWYSPPGGRSYFDPILWEDGDQKSFDGYAPDIFTDAAIDFIRENDRQPFFAFLSFNTPHHPLTVSDSFAKTYRERGFSEYTSRFYGMIENIDYNFGRVLTTLKETRNLDNTLIIFLSDNGTSSLHRQDDLWEIGLRGRKTYVYENGIRVPMFIRLPQDSGIAGRTDQVAMAEDLMPTVLEAAGIESSVLFDGVSLLPLLQRQIDSLPDRPLVFQFHRGATPVHMRNIAVRTGDYKLVQPIGRGDSAFEPDLATFELYELSTDPHEKDDLSQSEPQRVATLIETYSNWADEVGEEPFVPRPIWIGSELQNPVILTRQDWWDVTMQDGQTGPYHLEVKSAGTYQLTFRWNELFNATHKVMIELGDQTFEREIHRSELEARIEAVTLQPGPLVLRAGIEIDGVAHGFRYIEIEKLSESVIP